VEAGLPASTSFAVARQPILDRDGGTLGYELLCRPVAVAVEAPEAATAAVILHAFGDVGLASFVGSARAFVNVTRRFLLQQRPLPLPPGRVVLELLEGQEVDDALLEVLREVSAAGFKIALDDFVLSPERDPLVELASYVKLDVREHSPAALARNARLLKARGVELIAEKVEDAEEHRRCMALGFDAFQGYFYERPETWEGRSVPTAQLTTLCELAATDSDVSLQRLERIVRRDAGIGHRLLRFANSALVSPLDPIRSLRQGLALLGTAQVRRWALLFGIAGVPDVPHVLLETARVRAGAAEALASAVPGADPDRAFIVGLFSLLDAITATPMPELLADLRLHPGITAALLHGDGPEGALLATLVAFEHGEPPPLGSPVSDEQVALAYRQQVADPSAPLRLA
jgi:EAL and modified HD-GYP domain-containing signal transduction protein